jgi:phosphoserine phosphatase
MKLILIISLLPFITSCGDFSEHDPLPSWSDSPIKLRIIEFVVDITNPNSSNYLPPAERIAVFDNDGTLWPEKPDYFQLLMIYEYIDIMVDDHPEWRKTQPFKAVLERDFSYLKEAGFAATRELSAAVTQGLSVSAYTDLSTEFIFKSRHYESSLLFADMAYPPMIEFISYLKESGFEVFIVSGGDVSFIRGFSEQLFRIPKHQVVGSSRKNTLNKQGMIIQRGTQFSSMNVGINKVLNINLHIGRRPVIAVGNSDGDLEMMRFVSKGNSLVMLLMHDDDERAYEYIEGAEQALEEAKAKGWPLISMKNDFMKVFSAPKMR